MRRFRDILCTLRRDRHGATIVEFGFIAPVLIFTIMGVLDLGYRSYTVALLQGSIQKAARDAGLEDGSTNATSIDTRVKALMNKIVPEEPKSTFEFDRAYYTSFTDVGQPEDFSDTNGDGECNNGEVFEDVNGNGTWDSDRGTTGQGGARDAVLYTVTVTYPRIFPLAEMIGMSEDETISASTVLRNQPFGEQNAASPTIGNCDT